MSHTHIITAKTRRAAKKYGQAVCLEAFRLNDVKGEGASSISCSYIACLRTTQAADAAINAGRELAYAAKANAEVAF